MAAFWLWGFTISFFPASAEKTPQTIILTIQDDGIGRSNASKTKGGLGLGIMAHRARIIGGELTVSDREGGGTIVTCIAPCGVYSMEDLN